MPPTPCLEAYYLKTTPLKDCCTCVLFIVGISWLQKETIPFRNGNFWQLRWCSRFGIFFFLGILVSSDAERHGLVYPILQSLQVGKRHLWEAGWPITTTPQPNWSFENSIPRFYHGPATVPRTYMHTGYIRLICQVGPLLAACLLAAQNPKILQPQTQIHLVVLENTPWAPWHPASSVFDQSPLVRWPERMH